jgi:hypothetical protein
MVAYINDFLAMMVISIASIALLLLIRPNPSEAGLTALGRSLRPRRAG